MNNFFAIGRLIKDVEVKYTRTNKAVAGFTIAVTRPFKNQNGDYESDFINCELWDKIAETMKEYTHKGDQIGIAGTIRTELYEDKEGNKRNKTYVLVDQIKFLSFGKKEEKKEEKNEIGNDLPTDEMPF